MSWLLVKEAVEEVRAILAGTFQSSAWISVGLWLILFLPIAITGWSAKIERSKIGYHVV